MVTMSQRPPSSMLNFRERADEDEQAKANLGRSHNASTQEAADFKKQSTPPSTPPAPDTSKHARVSRQMSRAAKDHPQPHPSLPSRSLKDGSHVELALSAHWRRMQAQPPLMSHPEGHQVKRFLEPSLV